MSNGSDKFNMFEDMDNDSTIKDILDDTDDVEVISITMKSESKKKYSSLVVSRTKEEYESFIESYYYETQYHPLTNEPYEVKVTVLKPEVNPLELLKPAYAYSTSH